MTELTSLFRNSPLEIMKDHMDLCLRASELLPRVLTPTPDGRADALDEIKKLEKEADQMKSGVHKLLARRLFMPISKDQMSDLIQTQDKIANRARDIAALFTNRFGELPEAVTDELNAFLALNLDVVRLARKTVHELDELVETGFRGAEADLVEELLDQLHRLESASDERQWGLFSRMREIEDQMHPVDAMFVYRIAHLIADLGDRANQTGRKLGQLLTR